MRQSVLFAAIGILAIGLVACGGNKPPAAQPTRAAAPATPPPAPPPSAPRDIAPQQDDYARLRGASAEEIDRMGLLPDIHFDFDKADLREGDRQGLSKNAEVLKKFDFLKVTIEGHCDERGTVEYNLALGERRARAAYDYLISLGVPGERLKTVSYGKEVPVCQESSEACWARNRRDKFTVTGKTAAR
jgi:peptidoglycan-associated lipoprotein